MASTESGRRAIGNAAGNAAPGEVPVSVCYLAPGVQTLIDVLVPAGATVRDAVAGSGILPRHPEIDLGFHKVGVFGKLRQLDDPVQPFDRVEIYRALTVDPKVARARRVAKTRRAGSREGRKWVTKEHR